MSFDLSHPIPLLILGDGPDLKTGLGRIGHDFAWLLCSMPEFRVGYLGRQGFGRAIYPWISYSFSAAEQWGENRIEEAWNDLSQGRRGIIFTIWDASRLLWFSQGETDFLKAGKFERWGYFMQDSEGVAPSRLPALAAAAMSGYDRVLLASKWAFEMAKGCSKDTDTDWMPHGINRSTFKPIDPVYGRSALGVPEDAPLIGCNMANQERKHWPTVFEAFAQLRKDARIWIHTDILSPVPGWGYWNIDALAVEYGIGDRIRCDNRPLSDTELAMRYSACDATVVISGGEGFCYPAAESLSCGTPVVTGSYGAQAELCRFLVQPQGFRIETQYNVRRAYYDPAAVAAALAAVIGEGKRGDETNAVEQLDWSKLGIQWKKWIKKGLG